MSEQAIVLAATSVDPWTRERLELIKRTVCPTGISDLEFELFIEVCKRSGLDPLTKEIFCVPRRVNVGAKDNPKWITKHEAQPAEAGLLARADRFADFRGIKAAAVYEGDEIEITEDTVRHHFNPAKRSGRLVGAWAQCFRDGRVLPVEYVTLAAYQQNTPQWTSKPDTMIVKCSRAAALRRSYPNAFKGLYLREEMPAEEFDVAATGATPPRARGLTAIPSVAEPRALPVPSPISEYGALATDELRTRVVEAEAWCLKNAKSRKLPEAQQRLAALHAELTLRDHRGTDEPPPLSDEDAPPSEPGSQG